MPDYFVRFETKEEMNDFLTKWDDFKAFVRDCKERQKRIDYIQTCIDNIDLRLRHSNGH